MPAIKLSPSSYRYSSADTFKLQIPELTLPAPNLVGLVGLNGSGKSTFLKIMARHLQPERFSCYLGENVLSSLPLSRFARHVTYLPQHIPFYPPYTVREALLHSQYPYNPRLRKNMKQDKKIQRYLEMFELDTLSNKLLAQLSGGQQKTVMLASVFAQDTPVLLLDEPFISLDIPHQWKLADIIKKSLHKEQILFLSSHNMELLFQSARILLFFQKGKILGPHTVEEIADNPSIMEETLKCTITIDEGKITKKKVFSYTV